MNIDNQVSYPIRDQISGQVSGQVYDQVWDQVRNQVSGQVWSQVRDQVRDQVWDQVWKICAETWYLVYEIKTSKKVVDNVTNLVYDAVINTIEKESSQ